MTGNPGKNLPPGAWQALLPRALALIDEVRVHGGVENPFWTLGGGTVLMFRYRHRLSKDIDVFVPDPNGTYLARNSLKFTIPGPQPRRAGTARQQTFMGTCRPLVGQCPTYGISPPIDSAHSDGFALK